MNIKFKYFLLVYCTAKTLFAKIKINVMKKIYSREETDKYAYLTSKKWAMNILKMSGAKLNIVGKENLPEGNIIVVSNHQGNFDTMALIIAIDKMLGFISKKEMGKIPLISAWMRELNCVFLDRDNPRDAIKTFNDAAENLKNGYSMVIFPEGTRSKGGEFGEFKKGSLKLATKVPSVPIVPVAIEGSYKVFERASSEDLEIKLIICKPIYLEKLSKEEKANLAEYCKEIIEENFKTLI